MIKNCRWCQNSFEITDADLEFYERVSPVFEGKKYMIPTPTLCPLCRQQRRLAFRNERKLYNRTCSKSGKEIISIYSPDKEIPVYSNEIWYSDQTENTGLGRQFDFNRSFFEQFAELKNKVPVRAVLNQSHIDDINSEYTNEAGSNKNCYLCFGAGRNQDCYYSHWINDMQNSIDCLGCEQSELLYDCVECFKSYNCAYSQNLESCSNCTLSYACVSCNDCFGCVNLRHKSYCIFNVQYSKEEYFEKMKSIDMGSEKVIREYRQKLREFRLQKPHLAYRFTHCDNVSGNNLHQSKNAQECFNCHYLEDCKWCIGLSQKGPIRDCYDFTIWGREAELVYESTGCGGSIYQMAFCNVVWHSCSNVYYSDNCLRIKDCFGCVGLKDKQYCILNRQYTKEEYLKLVPKIIEHMQTPLESPLGEGGLRGVEWGEFFPPSLSPFGYNETTASEYFPLTREEVIHPSGHVVETQNFASLHKGTNGTGYGNNVGDRHACPLPQGPIFHWSDYESPPPSVEKIITSEQMQRLPDNIRDIPDDILKWALTCEVSGKLYRIVKQELAFYREHHIPLPRRHPDQRYADRMTMRNKWKLWDRDCMKCGKAIRTTYAPNQKEILYCEECYLKEVY